MGLNAIQSYHLISNLATLQNQHWSIASLPTEHQDMYIGEIKRILTIRNMDVFHEIHFNT